MALFRRSHRPTGKPGEWFYCLQHGRVEEGPDCPAKDRMGPYATRGEAEHAMATAAARNKEWDNDPRWDDSAEGPGGAGPGGAGSGGPASGDGRA